jgi:carboxyl-terminal processing protease
MTETFYKELLQSPFSFDIQETIELDGKKAEYAANDGELREYWRKSLKYQVMTRLNEMIQEQDKLKERKDTVIQEKSFADMETEARKKVLKSQDARYKTIKKLERAERFAAFINAITASYDPHTNYFPPKDKEAFDISMTGRLEGIGATLQERDGYIKVQQIVPGSASWKQGQLKVGDVILKVAQGADEPVDIVDMSIDNAVKLIRGKKGTEVRLTVKKVDGSVIVIPIIRDVVMIEETFAKSALLKYQKKNVGYIKLPGFYADFNRNGGRNSWEDVRNEVMKLKKEKVEGIILDLRDNGGGSLEDAVNMAGLFIKRGPIVQVKSKYGEAQMLEDPDPSVLYDGPLVVMVNELSASASEILAAAMQDYRRGVIIGSNATYGKGTVQRMVNLDDYLPDSYESVAPLGSLKITFQKFYRVNGGATQLKGVTPDIILPDKFSYLEFGEKEQDYPMPWNEIAPASYAHWENDLNLARLKAGSKSRVDKNPTFSMLDQEGQRLKSQTDKTSHTLNLVKYAEEQKALKEEAKKYENILKPISGFEARKMKDTASENMAVASSDTSAAAPGKEFIKNLRKDAHVFEAFQVISDMASGKKGR